jgi:hypothetical protein
MSTLPSLPATAPPASDAFEQPGVRAGTTGVLRTNLRAHWRRYLLGLAILLYVLVFFRGLAWQWQAILSGSPANPPAMALRPPAPAAPNVSRADGRPSGGIAPSAPQARAKVPLPATDEPPPRNQTDQHGVFYDAQGIAVIGIDTDPSGVYNVPPGRQLRIGGPQGALFDVHPGGRITPATQVKEWPR